MFAKFSLSVIFNGQLKSMANTSGDRDNQEFLIFFLIPILSPIAQYLLDLHLTTTIVGIIVSAASIFAGLLLNLLVLLYSVQCSNLATNNSSETDENHDTDIKIDQEAKVIEYTFYNISFAIMIAVFLVVFSLLSVPNLPLLKTISELLVYYFGFQLFISVAQILKRFHSLLEFKITIKDKPDSLWRNSKNSIE